MLEKIFFKEGTVVRKGQVLFQIHKSEYQAKVLSAKAPLAKAEADLSQARERVDVIQAEAKLAEANTGHSLARSDLARYVPLAHQNAVTQVGLAPALPE